MSEDRRRDKVTKVAAEKPAVGTEVLITVNDRDVMGTVVEHLWGNDYNVLTGDGRMVTVSVVR